MFDVERMETIDADLALAKQGDRTAQMRVFDHHVPWLLTFARTVNDRIESGFYADIPESDEVEADENPDVLEDPNGVPIPESSEFYGTDEAPEVENEDIEDAPEDTSEGSEDSENVSEDAPETEEDSEAEPGSPTALAEEAAINTTPDVPEADAPENEDVLENDPDAPVDPDVIVGEGGEVVENNGEDD